MKVTPILTSILVNAFAVVGFVSVLLILSMKLVLGEKPRLACVNDRVFDFVSSHYESGELFELVRYPSRVTEGKSVFVLYNRKDRINGCIKDDKQIAMEVVGVKGEAEKSYPVEIKVVKTGLKISYSKTSKPDHHSLPIIWDMKSKMALVN